MPFEKIPASVDVNAKIRDYDGLIDGLYVVGNPAAAHAEIGTNGGGASGIRLYAPDGVTVLVDLDATTGDGTFQGDIVASTVTGSTVTGGTVETSASGQRIVLDGGSDSIEFYDPTGALVAQLVPNTAGQLNLIVGGSTFRFISGGLELISASLSFLGGQVVGDLSGNVTGGNISGDFHGRCLSTIVASSGDVSGTTVESTSGDITAAGAVRAGGAAAGNSGDLIAAHTAQLLSPPTTSTAANAWINTSTGRINESTSAKRFKTRIRKLRDGAKVLSLRPITFQDKAEAKADPDARRYWGLIAEDVAKVAPELVSYDAKGRPRMVMYDRVVVGLLDVVRDLSGRLERLEGTAPA